MMNQLHTYHIDYDRNGYHERCELVSSKQLESTAFQTLFASCYRAAMQSAFERGDAKWEMWNRPFSRTVGTSVDELMPDILVEFAKHGFVTLQPVQVSLSIVGDDFLCKYENDGDGPTACGAHERLFVIKDVLGSSLEEYNEKRKACASINVHAD